MIESEADGVVVDSVTDLSACAAGSVVITGSHGGTYSAAVAASRGVRAAIFNDAGFGLADAGIAGVVAASYPAIAVDHRSARIGEGAQSLDGVVSYTNVAAARLGVVVGDVVRRILPLLGTAELVEPTAPPPAADVWRLVAGGREVIALDSASQIAEEHTGVFVAVGSHGAAPGNDPRRALRHPVAFAAFNDAGRGRDDAGIGRLALLDLVGIPAVTVGHDSARIGDGRSTLVDGRVSAVNAAAAAAGARIGAPLIDVYARVDIAPVSTH
jgi:hypothetical protein